jgi:hypothetical protein
MLTWATSIHTPYQLHPSHSLDEDFLQQSLPEPTIAPMLPVILQQAIDHEPTPVPTLSPQQSHPMQLFDKDDWWSLSNDQSTFYATEFQDHSQGDGSRKVASSPEPSCVNSTY